MRDGSFVSLVPSFSLVEDHSFPLQRTKKMKMKKVKKVMSAFSSSFSFVVHLLSLSQH